MAAKMKCPGCKSMLKEEGDEGKLARGEYRVYDSIGFGSEKKRIIHCLKCEHMALVEKWAEQEFKDMAAEAEAEEGRMPE